MMRIAQPPRDDLAGRIGPRAHTLRGKQIVAYPGSEKNGMRTGLGALAVVLDVSGGLGLVFSELRLVVVAARPPLV